MKSSVAKVAVVAIAIFIDLLTLLFRVAYGAFKAKAIEDGESDHGSFYSCSSSISDYQSAPDLEIYSEEVPLPQANGLARVQEELNPLVQEMGQKDLHFLNFIKELLSSLVKEEDVLSAIVVADPGLGSIVRMELKNPLSLEGTLKKKVGWLNAIASFSISLGRHLIFGNADRTLTFLSPVDFTVELFGQSQQTYLTHLTVELDGDKPYFSYRSTVQDSILHYDEILSFQLNRV